MPSPLNNLKSSFRQGTQLGRTSLEEATSRTGAIAPPTSPLGAAGIGASPDAAKMAGSSAQQNRVALQPSESERLQDVLRRRTMAREETPEEQARRGTASGLSGLSSLQGRVQELVTAQFNAATSAGPVVFTPDSSKISTLYPAMTDTQRVSLSNILIAVNNKTVDARQLADAAGLLNVKADEVGAKLQSLLKDTSTDTAGAAIGDRLLMTEKALTDMGTSSGALGKILGISEKEVLDLTSDELVGKIRLVQQRDFSRVAALRAIVNDPNSGPAERQAAQEQLLGMGAAGVTSTEASFDRLNSEIADGGSVTINGKTVSVSEALSDKFLSGLIKTIIDDTDPVATSALRADYPGLVAFIDANKLALKNITDGLSGAATVLVGIQTTVKSSGGVEGAGTFSAGSMGAGGVDTTGKTIYATPPRTPAIVDIAKKLPAETSIRLVGNTNKIEELSGTEADSVISGIMNADTDTLNQSGYADNSDIYYSYVEDFTQLANSTTTSQVLGAVFGPDITEDELNKEIAFARRMKSLGLAADIDPLFDILDRDKDGKIDDAVSLKESLKNFLTPDGRPMTLAQLVAAGKGVKDLPRASSIRDILKKGGSAAGSGAVSMVSKYGDMLSSGKIDNSVMDVAPINDLSALIKLNVPGANEIKAILERRVAAELPKLFDKEGTMKIKAQYAGRGQQADVDIFEAHTLTADGYMMTTGRPDWANNVSSGWAGNARLYIPALDKFSEKWESIKNDEGVPVAVREAFLNKYSQLKLTVRRSYEDFLKRMIQARKKDIASEVARVVAIAKQENAGKYGRLAEKRDNETNRLLSIDVASEVAARFPADRGKFD